jgi:hypothetical protein
MPNQYTNPDVKPCAGSFSWQPPTASQIGSLDPTKGFDNLVIDRGAFRNLFYNSPSDSNVSIYVNPKNQQFGKFYFPVRNTTRPLTLTKKIRGANNNNFVIYPSDDPQLYKLYNFTDPKSNFNVASIEIEVDFYC